MQQRIKKVFRWILKKKIIIKYWTVVGIGIKNVPGEGRYCFHYVSTNVYHKKAIWKLYRIMGADKYFTLEKVISDPHECEEYIWRWQSAAEI